MIGSSRLLPRRHGSGQLTTEELESLVGRVGHK